MKDFNPIINCRKKLKKYSVQKINLNTEPHMQKFLSEFFTIPENYFDNKFDGLPVIVGKKYNNGNKFNTIHTVKRHQTKKKNKRESVSRINSFSSESAKKQSKEHQVEIKQKYLNDQEIDKMFEEYRNINDKNLRLTFSNYNQNPLKEKLGLTNQNILKYIKTAKFNIKKEPNNFERKLRHLSHKNSYIDDFLEIKKQKIKRSISDKNICIKNNLTINLTNNSLDNKKRKISINTPIVEKIIKYFDENESNRNSNKISLNNKDIKKNLFKNKLQKVKINKSRNITGKNKTLSLFKKDPKKSEINNLLTLQEHTLINRICFKYKEKYLSKNISEKIKNNENNLLLNKIDSYVNKKELNNQIQTQILKYNPNMLYNWENDLRSHTINNKTQTNFRHKPSLKSENFISKIVLNPKVINTVNADKIFFKNQYLQTKLTPKNIKELNNKYSHIKNNYSNLVINGENLLEKEYRQIKLMKGKKVLYTLNNNLKENEINEKIFANNFNYNNYNKRNFFNQ